MIGIYCYRHEESGKLYVGKSLDIARRIRNHNRRSAKKHYIDRAIKKYGKDAFEIEILELCDEGILDIRECHWIAALDCVFPNGYNLTTGGEGGRLSEETKRKMEESQAGMRGKRHTLESRQRMSVSHKGKVLSGEHVENMSKALRERWQDPEYHERMSELVRGKNNHFYGKKHTDEAKAKISEANKGRLVGRKREPFSAETRAKLSKAHRGRVPWNKGKKGVQKAWNKGVKAPPEVRQKMSESAKRAWQRKKRNSEQLTLFED